MAPHGIYPCQGDDQWIAIVVESDEQWKKFCRVMDDSDLCEDERFRSTYERLEQQEALDEAVSNWTRRHSKYEATDILQSAGIAAAPVLSREEKLSDPQLVARGDFTKTCHPVSGEETLDANPWRLSKTPPEIYRHAPLVGEHNDYVYGELLKMSASEIRALQEEKVIY
jgi:crotonobetainyl-CoA:carnitine CoA-transferase CaiB-like acyl-CoA transferase